MRKTKTRDCSFGPLDKILEKKIVKGAVCMCGCRWGNGHFKGRIWQNINYLSCQIPYFVIFFFDVELILSVKMCKKVSFKE